MVWVGYLLMLSLFMIWLDIYDVMGLVASDWFSVVLNIDGNCTSLDN